MALVALLIPCFVISFDVTHSCQNADNFVGASSPGDIVIGGLFAIHGKMLHPEEHPMRPVIQNCAGFEIQVFLQTLAMIHAIEMINNSTLLSGIILGYEIYDTCAEVTKAMGAALRFLAKFNASKDTVEYKCNYSDYIPRIKAVIGSSYSEIAMAVSRILNLQLIPLVSHASSAEILSDKIRFPSFLRTVPSDFYQTRGMVRLIHRSGWNWIGLIATDDDYGRSALESFGIQAMANKLLEELKKVTFTDNEKEVHFDAKGDLNMGYDVLLWKEISGHIVITEIAEYDLQKDDFIFKDEEKEMEFLNFKKVKSTCSRKCRPGQMKKVSASPHTCCYECVNCPEDHYTNQTDMDYCFLCNNKTHWAPVNSTTCYKKTVEYLSWNDWFAILLIILSGLGVVLIFAISTIFTRNLDTPVVKASGGLTVCYVILLCHFFIFASTSFFIGEPREFKCKSRQAFFGISFALCISCILMKSLKILLAFSFDPKLQNFLKCLYKPIPIVVTCTGIQVVICTFWVIFRSPFVEQNFFIRRVIILECNEGSIVAFGVILGYIAALAFICFIFAFKGRKLPENYNEAKFITFGMLIYFIAWITFIPVYTTTFGKYRPAVEITVILISNYGILCCNFLPKCYIILYKQETNTKSAFLKIIYNYSSKSVGSLTVNQISLESNCTNPQYPITNSCCKSEKTSVNGNCHFEVSKHSLIREKVPPKNTAGTISRKRLSSI
ncbi:G-protein coupled receptor family C group 6 member A isoform X2 [Dermochelys coriacea]|uniref:G-protein coupled receptor family C group 6 member A isoform X2 n=1 Tax=Dermochelys coriacea TaxID=27794 RepID=UPI0018E84844|nr:G-protein coupled receptor family C group 6 member A isoform X2 [Dermochelys coriacea]